MNKQLSLKQKGLQITPIFPNTHNSKIVDDNIYTQHQKNGFEQSSGKVFYRSKKVENQVVSYQVLVENQVIQIKNGSDYLSQAVRSIQFECGKMIEDLVTLKKIKDQMIRKV